MSVFLGRTATRPGHTTRLSRPGHTIRLKTMSVVSALLLLASVACASNKVACPICPKSFQSEAALLTHMKTDRECQNVFIKKTQAAYKKSGGLEYPKREYAQGHERRLVCDSQN